MKELNFFYFCNILFLFVHNIMSGVGKKKVAFVFIFVKTIKAFYKIFKKIKFFASQKHDF